MQTTPLDRPLAVRYRPDAAESLIGQEMVWAPGTPLWKMVHADSFHSLLFWGPPGTGKTSLARLIGQIAGRELCELSAVEAGVKDIREIIVRSREQQQRFGSKTEILFLDEIHRLNRSQQDCLLPAVESGDIKLVGATTENPSFSVNNALLSRSLTIRLQKIDDSQMAQLVQKIANREQRPLSNELAAALARASDGDARAAINLLEAALSISKPSSLLGLEEVKLLLPMIARHYDKSADSHYDLISAFIKSIRASDPDAALYYLARMLSGGEDPVFIGRRLVIAASEDIGNAHSTVLVVAQASLSAVREIGMPEARIILAQATTYLASSPKSNRSYKAIQDAFSTVEATGDLPVPMHLRNAPTRFMREQGYGKNYVNPHEHSRVMTKVTNLPEALAKTKFYYPSDQGSEKQIQEFLNRQSSKED